MKEDRYSFMYNDSIMSMPCDGTIESFIRAVRSFASMAGFYQDTVDAYIAYEDCTINDIASEAAAKVRKEYEGE